MIDIHDPLLNQILNSCLFIILGLTLISLVPWKLGSGKNRWTLILPVAAILVYLIYEFAMPDNWDIRMDLVLVWPALGLIILTGLIRVLLIRRHKSRSHGNGAD